MGSTFFSSEDEIFATFLAGGTLLVFLIFFVIRFIFVSHRNVRRFQQQQLLHGFTQVEKERSWTSSELHDNFSAHLVTLKQMLQTATGATHHDQDLIAGAGTTVDSLIQSVRQSINKLSMKNVERIGFHKSLSRYLQSVSLASSVNCQLAYQLHEEPDPVITLNVYRVIQELLQNMIKHAHAENFELRLWQKKDNIIITAVDDGIGFYYDPENQWSGLGLNGIRSRIDMLGGNTRIFTSPGAGTTFYFTIPLNTNYEENYPG